jgi:hypothetical protein
VRLVSVGSGDSSVEIDITKALVAAGHCDMEFLCFDVAHNLIADANAKIRRAGLTSVMKSQFFDVNVDALPEPIDGIMAHHSLHHIVELERLFSMIDAALMPNGRFLSIDMIGRNGHVRWPETLGYIQALWEGLPDEKKYHHQLKQLHAEYLNFDCSEEGFEGIRSQDILPLLVSRFSFRMFMGLGGLVEIFTDRGYGHNYDVNSAWDTAFIDFVEELNERLLQIGLIKPTMLFADMAKKGRIVEPRYYKSRSPAFSIRRMW